MSLRVKVLPHIETLCATCKHGTFYEGRTRGGGEHAGVYCHMMNEHMRCKVADCSSFAARNDQSLHDMRMSAWLLLTDPIKKTAGFVHPSQVKESERWKSLPMDDD